MRETVSTVPMNIRKGERLLLAVGLTLLSIWTGARFYGVVESHAAMDRFQANAATVPGANNGARGRNISLANSEPDFALWNPKRVIAYRDSLSTKTDLPLAILHIPKIGLEVPVFNDTDDLTLNRGVGRIFGMAQIGQPGNLGIAGHRDGFLRGLQDVARGDIIELVGPGRTDRYVISQLQIVPPEDVSVLAPSPTPILTLITCFP